VFYKITDSLIMIQTGWTRTGGDEGDD